MKLGQIPENVYERSVIKEIQYKNENISGGAVSGEACAFFVKSGEEKIFVASDNKNAGLNEMSGLMAIYSAVNALEATGAVAEAVNINMLMPHRFSEEKLKLIMREINQLSTELKVQLASFNGEMLNELLKPVLSVNAFGSIDKLIYENKKKPYAGQDLVITKWVGMAGTVILADNKRDELTKRFSASYIDGAAELRQFMSIKKENEIIRTIKTEAALAGKSCAITGMPVSKGGIYKTLWDMAVLAGTGLEVNLKDISIRQETVELCNYFDLNPYELYSEGCLLVACDSGKQIVNAMNEADISAAVIGRLTGDNDRVVINDYERKFLTKPVPDELTKIEI